MIANLVRAGKSTLIRGLGALGYGLVKLSSQSDEVSSNEVGSPTKISAASSDGIAELHLDPFIRRRDSSDNESEGDSRIDYPDVFFNAPDMERKSLGDLLDLLESYARPLAQGRRILVWPFERTGATGHLCMEPFYIKSLFGADFDEIIVITRQRHSCHNSNTEIFDASMAGMKVAFTDDPYIFNLSGYEIGVFERGPFTFFLHSYAQVSRAFFHHCLEGRRKAFFSLSAEQEARGRKAFVKLGIPAGAKWVVAHAREGGFHPRVIDNHRCTSIESYFDSMKYLASEGYYVLRIGDRTMKHLPDLGRNVIDVPFLPNYDFIMDVYAIARCEFMMSAHSGPCMLARAFDRPCLAINVPLILAHIPGERDMIAPRHYLMAGKDGNPPQRLSYSAALDFGMQYVALDKIFREKNVILEELTSAQVLPITKEMLRRRQNPDTQMPILHDRFMAVNRLANERAARDLVLQRARYDWYGLAKPGSAVPDAYCEQFPDFL